MRKDYEFVGKIDSSKTVIQGGKEYATITFHRYCKEPIKIGFESYPQSTDELLDLKTVLDAFVEARGKFREIN